MATADASAHNAAAHTLKPEEIAWYAAQAGFTGEALRNIVAIALAESGGNVAAVGDGGKSHGLWQVYAPAHPQYDQTRLVTDPAYAAKAAFEISGGGKNFDPWTTWSHTTHAGAQNAAQAYLDTASKAVGVATAAGYAPPAAGVAAAAAPPAAAEADITPDTPPAVVEAYIRTHYPDVAALMKGDEAIRWILYDAAINGRDATEIQAAIRQTDYWREHGPDSRAFDAFLAENGENSTAVADLIGRAKTVIGDMFSRNDVHLDDTALGELAKQAIRAGAIDLRGDVVQPDALNRMLAFGLGATPGALHGAAGGAAADLAKVARSYLVPVDDKTLKDWELQIVSGAATTEGFADYVRGLAKEAYRSDATLQKAIDDGTTLQQYFAPHVNAIAQTLEVDPGSLDLNDPRWRNVLSFADPTTKQVRPMSWIEAADLARHSPAYKGTHQFTEGRDGKGMAMLQELGLVKT